MSAERESNLLRPLDIAEAQEIALGVLRELDDFCQRAGIEYFLVGGTLIGAVRSGDLIPWDDDIDVAMKRDDYERFCAEYVDNEAFSLLTYRRAGNYRHGMAKLVDNRTVFVEPTVRDNPCGVFVDVFPLDYVSSKNDPAIKRVNNRVRAYNYAHVISPVATKGSLLKAGIRIVLGQTAGRCSYARAMDNLESMMKSGEGPFLTNHWGAWGAKECAPLEWFSRAVPVQLRGRSYPAPVGYHEYLTQLYGDYMSPPADPPHCHGQAFKKVDEPAQSVAKPEASSGIQAPASSYPDSWGGLFYLAMCALMEQPADAEVVANMDLDRVFREARRHSVAALVAAPLLALWRETPAGESVMVPWEQADAEAAYRHLVAAAERAVVSDWMEQQGIWHVPLKGVLICDLYPAPHLRECCDVDILFDTAYRTALREHMEGCGYTFCTFEQHDIYRKAPIYNFEMHLGLVHPGDDATWAQFYANVRERLVPAKGRSFELRFTNEEFYVHMVVHAAQHIRDGGGTGVRTLFDLGVMLRAWGTKLDWRKIDAMIAQLGLTEQERLWRSLATKLFSDADGTQPLTAEEGRGLAAMVNSGTYGSLHAKLQQQIVDRQADFGGLGRAKWAYVKHRAFPPYEEMSRYHEELQGRPWLLPYCWAKRIVVALGHKERYDELRRVLSL